MQINKERQKKVGILTFHYSFNYGALLQCYALSTVLRRMDLDVRVINCQRGHFYYDGKENKLISFIRNCKLYIRNLLYFSSFFSFRKKYFQPFETKRVWGDDMVFSCEGLDSVIVGSDQVWRWNYIKDSGYTYFLDFVPDNIKKISYAASFGTNKFEGSEKDIERIKLLLKKFNTVSVRENVGVQICKNLFDIDAAWVLDPTLLLDVSDYSLLMQSEPKEKSETPFIGHYLLSGSGGFKRVVLNRVVQQLGITNVKSVHSTHSLIKHKHASVASWLSSIKDSTFFVTNSFHGVVFSIIFQKQFVCIGNEERGNCRMESLLNQLGLGDKIIYKSKANFTANCFSRIDYAKVHERLVQEREKSFHFLRDIFR